MKSPTFLPNLRLNKLFDFITSFSPIYQYNIQGNSMTPLLKPGQIVFINRLTYMFTYPKKGDILIFKHPMKDIHLIKQIDKIEHGKYFVVGVNLEQSTDSRHFGLVERKHIIGKVMV